MSHRAPGRHRAPRFSALGTVFDDRSTPGLRPASGGPLTVGVAALSARPMTPSRVLGPNPTLRTTAALFLTGGLAAGVALPAGADPGASGNERSASGAAVHDWSQRTADEQAAQEEDTATPTSSGGRTASAESAHGSKTGDQDRAIEAAEAGKERAAKALTGRKSTRALAPRAATPKAVSAVSRPMRGRAGALMHASGLSGIRYVWGGTTTAGFDCSGFTRYVYRKAGVNLPRTAAQQQRAVRRVSTPSPGDLVFFGRPAHHVGIYAGKGKMYDAPRRGKSTGLHKIWSATVTYGRVAGVRL